VTLVGSPAPEFTLRDLEARRWQRSDLLGRIGVLVFWSCECAHVERFERDLQRLAPMWGAEVGVWRVASGANESVERLRQKAEALDVGPVLLDPDQAVADVLAAEVTPHVVVLDRQGIIRYLGAPDDVTLRQRHPTRSYLGEAVDALLRGALPDPAEVRAFGCVLVRRSPPLG
jgi:peroxiredoxin